MAKSDNTRNDFSNFKPRGNKGRSFSRNSSRSRNRDNSRDPSRSRRSDSKERTDKKEFKLYPVVCSSCGKKTEVPFKPTQNKPVYCSECFEKNNKGNNNQDITKRLDAIEKKLDLILEVLDME